MSKTRSPQKPSEQPSTASESDEQPGVAGELKQEPHDPRRDTEFASRLVESLSSGISRVRTSIGESFDEAVSRALSGREHVLMVRINRETRDCLDELTDAGLFKSRSESAAFLLSEGVAARQDIFDKIHEKLESINQMKDELKRIVREEN